MNKTVSACLVFVVMLNGLNFVAADEVRNNFVTELVNRDNVQSSEEIRFSTPREGWVFFSLAGEDGGELYLGKDRIILHPKRQALPSEAMRYLPQGTHTIRVRSGAPVRKLIVRSIPEILFNAYRRVMCVPELNSPTWEWAFLKKYVHPNVNTMVVTRVSAAPAKAHVREWLQQGKRWLKEDDIPLLTTKARFHVKTEEEAYEWFVQHSGFAEPYISGYLGDEFLPEDNSLSRTRMVIAAMERIMRNPKFKGKQFYPYVESPTRPVGDYKYLCEFVVKNNGRLAREWYCAELPAKKNMLDCFAPAWHAGNRKLWREKCPGAEDMRIQVFGAQDLPYSNMDVDPGLDYKVWLDWQFKFIATDPSFIGIRGVMCYNTSYQDEELVRWTGKLYRHYCIEGHTDLLSKDPYVLTYIRNPDFDEGTSHWPLEPAEEGSIRADKREHYGHMQGRFGAQDRDVGNHFLITRRSSDRPNVFRQTIKNLTPGRYYTFRMYTSDYNEVQSGWSANVKHPVSITIEGAKELRRVQQAYPGRKDIKPFTGEKVCYFNFHWVLFRAESPEAQLVISDWVGRENPGGMTGQNIAFNFMQIQPYLSDKD